MEDKSGGLKQNIPTQRTLGGGLSGGLNEPLKEVCEHISNTPGIKGKDLALLLSKSINTIEKQIKQLIDKGLIERRGSRKTGGYYKK